MPMQDNAFEVTRTLLRAMGRRVDTATLDDVLVSSPDYPSLGSVCDALAILGVVAEAYEVDPTQLDDIPVPHIAHLKNDLFVLATRVDQDAVTIEDGIGKSSSVSIENYLKMWSGVALVPVGVGKSTYSPPPAAPRVPAWAAVTAALATAAAFGLLAWPDGAVALLGLPALCKLAGLTACVFLLLEEWGLNTPASRFCRQGSKVNCRSVLTSSAAKLGPIGMVDIGIGYFAGGLLCLTLAPLAVGGAATVGFTLKWANILALPYTVFSIDYQGLKLRHWCPLCLLVQLVIWLEALCLFSVMSWPPPGIESGAWALVMLFPLPYFAWLLARPVVEKSFQLRNTRIKLERMVRHPAVVQALIMEESEAPLPAVPLELISGGGPQGDTLVIYTDPTCPHCADRHRELDGVAERLDGRLRIVVRLLGPMENQPRAHALLGTIGELLAAGHNDEAYARMRRWYAGTLKDSELSDPAAISSQAREILRRHRQMMQNPPFHKAPVLFFAGRPWPEHLPLSSLAYLDRWRNP